MLLLALPGEGQAQTFYRENETAIDIFHKLDELFPKRFNIGMKPRPITKHTRRKSPPSSRNSTKRPTSTKTST